MRLVEYSVQERGTGRRLLDRKNGSARFLKRHPDVSFGRIRSLTFFQLFDIT